MSHKSGKSRIVCRILDNLLKSEDMDICQVETTIFHYSVYIRNYNMYSIYGYFIFSDKYGIFFVDTSLSSIHVALH